MLFSLSHLVLSLSLTAIPVPAAKPVAGDSI